MPTWVRVTASGPRELEDVAGVHVDPPDAGEGRVPHGPLAVVGDGGGDGPGGEDRDAGGRVGGEGHGGGLPGGPVVHAGGSAATASSASRAR